MPGVVGWPSCEPMLLRGVCLVIGETSSPKSGHSLKTGFLVSAFKDSDDMEGMKSKRKNEHEAIAYARWYLRLGYETVMIERTKS